MLQKLLLTGLGLYLFKTFKGKAEIADNLQFSFNHDVKFSPGVISSKLNIPLSITNPTTSMMTVSSIYGTVIVDGKEIGKFNVLKTLELRPKSSSIVRINLDIQNISLVGKIFQILTLNKTKKINALIKGSTATNYGNFSFENSVQIGM